MAKGSPVLSVRIPAELLELVDQIIARTADTRQDGPWTRSSFIIAAEGVDFLESQLPTNQILYKIFRDTEAGVMVYPKALTSKTS